MPTTIDTVIDQLTDNADFAATSDVAKARLFLTAAIQFLILSPASQGDQGTSMSIAPETVRALMNKAQQLVDAAASVTSSTNASVRFLSAKQGFRK
jgi:hypothetical protein